MEEPDTTDLVNIELDIDLFKRLKEHFTIEEIKEMVHDAVMTTLEIDLEYHLECKIDDKKFA